MWPDFNFEQLGVGMTQLGTSTFKVLGPGLLAIPTTIALLWALPLQWALPISWGQKHIWLRGQVVPTNYVNSELNFLNSFESTQQNLFPNIWLDCFYQDASVQLSPIKFGPKSKLIDRSRDNANYIKSEFNFLKASNLFDKIYFWIFGWIAFVNMLLIRYHLLDLDQKQIDW